MIPAFLDANIPIYAAGGIHPLKEPSRQILSLTVAHPEAFVTDAEVLQEILHRYLALRLWPQGREVYRHFSEMMEGKVEPVYGSDVDRAAALAGDYPSLQARDLVHAAVMERLGLSRIVSADKGFDKISTLERLDPANLSTWRTLIQD